MTRRPWTLPPDGGTLAVHEEEHDERHDHPLWFDEKPGNVAETWRWMADPKIAGVGAFGDLGTHSLDVLMWLLGPVESVSAEVRVVTGRYGDCDETGTAMLKMKDGVVATLVAGWVDVANPVTLQIAGTEGHAVIVQGAG